VQKNTTDELKSRKFLSGLTSATLI